ncbi:MAG: hypothetical protein WD009_10390 [Phycisphaeraceae bacterium]
MAARSHVVDRKRPALAAFGVLLLMASNVQGEAMGERMNETEPAGRRAAQVSQHGITWTFDREYPVGQFVNGDWWVVGPVTVVEVTPAPGPAPDDEVTDLQPNNWGDTGLRDNPDLRNGSMVVMEPGGGQAYDSRGRTFNAELSVEFPYELPADRSLISSISHTTAPNLVMHHELMWPGEQRDRRVMRTAAILTSLSEAPPEDAFRPTYVGAEKRIYRAGDLRWDRLLNLSPPDESVMPSWEQYERYFERPWLDHLNASWLGQWLLPTENQPAYYREWSRITAIAALMLHLDVPRERKRDLLIGLVQYGIDARGIAEVGGRWVDQGSGRKWPILFAGLMLDDPHFFNMPASAIFKEDVHTYYGQGWFGQTALYQLIGHHGPREPYEHVHPDDWAEHDDGWARTGESYRLCCTIKAWVGTALAAQLMEARQLWNHDAFFDNVERWMREDDPYADRRGDRPRPDTEGTSFDPFVDAMWRRHREAVPDQPGGDTHRMWSRVDGEYQWVPNPKPE